MLTLRTVRFVAASMMTFSAVACGGAATDGDLGESSAAATAGGDDAAHINVGFAGQPGQFSAFEEFWKATKYQPGAHLCHTYLSWDVATSDTSAASDFEAYLAEAAPTGGCDEILVSFQTQATSGANPSSPSELGAAVNAFLDRWGGAASFAFTAFNEPNNRAGAGNGTGHATASGTGFVIAPETAAEYYLAVRRACSGGRCKVAAGDFASDGVCYDGATSTKSCIEDYQQVCPDEVVSPSKICRGATYLDRYKNAIAFYAKDYGLPEGFRPEYFAYHGWKEVNDFVYGGKKECTVGNCATKAIVAGLQGSWGKTIIWNSEVGAGQSTALSDRTQAEGVALLLDLAGSTSKRIYRVYYMGVTDGPWNLLCPKSGKRRPSFGVLADRSTSYAGGVTDVCAD